MVSRLRASVLVLVLTGLPALAGAQAPVSYRLSFPEPEHRWMQVEATFEDLPAAPLELRMSRSSPGRYAVHEFAKNVFDVRITDPGGAPLQVSRPNPHQWNVGGHAGQVRVAYRIFGDRIDGTYLAVDSTHAHINMPAALMWARGLEHRPVEVRFEQPPHAEWRVGTQLLPGGAPLTYTAPNLQYLMDSPAEFSAFSLRTFTADDAPGRPLFRLVVHHAGTDAELDRFAADVERIVRETRHVFGEYPAFEGNTYTFIADYLPWASSDGMEHRNSAVLTSASSIGANRLGLLDTVAHEFLHAWNVERIRPRSLEPFDFEDASMSGELWMAEGFTSYYAPLVMVRAGLIGVDDFAAQMSRLVNVVRNSPGRAIHSVEEMSRLAPFVDAAAAIDRTNFENLFISYYTWGAAIGLGLDLALRERSDGKVTLDDYMRALWGRHGAPGGALPGHVDRPYTPEDLKTVLAEVSGDAGFAEDFFVRYVHGREIADYARLLERVGFVLRPVSPDAAWAGELRLQDVQGRPRVVSPVPFGSPAYAAGLERDDVIVAIGGANVASAFDVERAVRARKPGDEVPLVFERRGERVAASLRFSADPRLEVVGAEAVGRALSSEQRRLRDEWLGSVARSTF